jgi:hypothetical protein
MRYGLSPGDGLIRFLDDGRIEIDSNMVERSIRPIALNRKDALFAGSDSCGEIVNGHPSSQIDDLLPWAYPLLRCSRAWPVNAAYERASQQGTQTST